MDTKNQKQIEEIERKYQDPHGVSIKKLNFGLWYIEHKDLMRKAFLIFLGLVAAISWGYTIYGFGYYIAKGMQEDENINRNLIATGNVNLNYLSQTAPKNLAIGQVQVLNSGFDNKFDYIVKITNPNPKIWADFEYDFAGNGTTTETESGFILPGDSKYIMSLANDGPYPEDLRLQINNLTWHRIDAHEIGDWRTFRDNHLAGLSVANINYSSGLGSSSGTSTPGVDMNHVSFDVTNNTAYNYANLGFDILMSDGTDLVAVNKYTIDSLMSSQSQHIDVIWSGSLPSSSQISVIPEVNIMDKNVYLNF